MALAEIDFNKLLKGSRHDGHQMAVSHAEEMAVHIYAAKPIRLLERVRPREDEEVRKYRLDSYEPITTATADKAMVTVQKIMNPKLYRIEFPDTASELEQYLRKNYPYYRDFMTYVNDVMLRAMMGDPNAVAIVIPIDMTISDTVKARPIVEVVPSKDIWDYKFADWYLIHRKTEKDAKDGKTEYYFHYIDKTSVQYIEVTVYNNNSDRQPTVEVLEQYNHNIGEPPVWLMSGIITKVGLNGPVYRSYFSAALPHWNKAVTGDSDLDGAYVNHMHPIRVEQTEECGFTLDGEMCREGQIEISGKTRECPSCGGTGRKSVRSPYGVYQVPKPGLGEQASPIAPVSFVSVPVEPTRMLEERVQAQLDKGLKALNMYFEVGEDQSGIAKVLDRSELYDFLLTVSGITFDFHIYNIIRYTAEYLYLNKTESKMPTIQKPVTFDLLTVQEEAAVLQNAQTAKMNPTYIRSKMLNLMQKDLYGRPMELAMSTDSLLFNTLSGYTTQEVTELLSTGLVENIDAIIYANINKIIQDLYAADPNFGEKPYEEKQAAIVAQAMLIEEASEPEPTPASANET